MTERLSNHEKQLLMRYRLLLTRFHSAPVQIKLSELAEIMHCTQRYARTQLRNMQQAGWLSWLPGVGRGASGILWCQVDAAALQALLDGDYVTLTQENSVVAPPQFSADTKGDHFIVPFYRPLMKITPSLYTIWPERHLIRMVHSGLMRHVPGRKEPVPSLARAADISPDGLMWTFHLRRGLFWHSGEPLDPAQLLPVLERRARGPELPHVMAVELFDHTLRLKLSAPDVLLLHRLAHPINAFAHPEEDTNGLGPFRVSMQSRSSLELQRSPFWYGERPEAAKISFKLHPCEKPDWSTVTLESGNHTQPDIPSRCITGESGFTFLMFNNTRNTLEPEQRAVVRRILQGLMPKIIDRLPSVSALPEWLCCQEHDAEPTLLPPELNVVYCRMPETTLMMEELRKSFLWRGCRLNVTPRLASHWLLPGEDWSGFDFCVGFQPLGENQAEMFEEHYRKSPMFKIFMGEAWDAHNKELLTRAAGKNIKQHEWRVMRAFRAMLRNDVITPLYIQRWNLYVPDQARDIEVNDFGWPDFTRIWMP
ncbi:SgrR family transcriptional regulator [Cronobacter turicensis]|nr:SgrR family transcriptional regulator [Cronobacter turicensis]